MKKIKIDDNIFNNIQKTEDFEFIVPVTRMPRQTFLTQNVLNNVDVIAKPGSQGAGIGLWELKQRNIVNDKEILSNVTCIRCSLVDNENSNVVYVAKKSKCEMHVDVKDVDAIKIDGVWMWKIAGSIRDKKKHNYIHSLLSYSDIESVLEFIEERNYQNIDGNSKYLFNLVRNKKITTEQFDILCTWFFKD